MLVECLPLRFYLVSFLSSVTSGMEGIVMHEQHQDMQLTYQNILYKKQNTYTFSSDNLLGESIGQEDKRPEK